MVFAVEAVGVELLRGPVSHTFASHSSLDSSDGSRARAPVTGNGAGTKTSLSNANKIPINNAATGT